MAGDAERDVREEYVSPTQRCTVTSCQRCAIASCFECERFCCERHLSAVSLAITACPTRVQVCPDCLLRYRSDPDIRALLTIDA